MTMLAGTWRPAGHTVVLALINLPLALIVLGWFGRLWCREWRKPPLDVNPAVLIAGGPALALLVFAIEWDIAVIIFRR